MQYIIFSVYVILYVIVKYYITRRNKSINTIEKKRQNDKIYCQARNEKFNI
jgi:hypothetical protein